MAPPARTATRRARQLARGLSGPCFVAALAAAPALSGCSHAWDDYDPRLRVGADVSTTGGGAGGAGGSGSTTTTGGTTTTSSGMGGAGGMPGAGGSGGGFPPNCPDGHIPLVDDFNDGVIGPEWGTYMNAATVAETGGAVEISLLDPTLPETYAGLYAQALHDLRDCAVFTRVSQLPDPSTDAYTGMYASSSDGTYIEVIHEAGILYFKKVIANEHFYLLEIPYDPAEHAYWRLRESAGMTYWETSADAETWVTQTSAPDPIPLDAVDIGLSGGTYQVEPVAPGTAKFEGVNVP